MSSRGHFALACGDAVAWLRTLPSESADLVVTDIAYESLEKHRAVGTTTRLTRSKASSNDWFTIFPNARIPELFSELYRVLKDGTHCYFYCDSETLFLAEPMARGAGFRREEPPIVWDKVTIGMGYHYRARYEWILFLEKGTPRPWCGVEVADVLEVKRVYNGYPTEKPSLTSEIVILQSTEPGALVIDPFLGSGSVGEAALVRGRTFAGNDLCAESVDVARKRLVEARGLEVPIGELAAAAPPPAAAGTPAGLSDAPTPRRQLDLFGGGRW